MGWWYPPVVAHDTRACYPRKPAPVPPAPLAFNTCAEYIQTPLARITSQKLFAVCAFA